MIDPIQSISILCPQHNEVNSMMTLLTATLLLAIACCCVYLHQGCNHEVTKVLTVAIAVVCLIWGLAIAPWGFNLLGLWLLMRYQFPFMFKPVLTEK